MVDGDSKQEQEDSPSTGESAQGELAQDKPAGKYSAQLNHFKTILKSM